MEKEKEHWEPLGPNCRVLVTKEHGFTTDTLLLAHFSMPKNGEHCVDIGTGCGTIPLLWSLRAKPGNITGVELQSAAAELARRSVEENGLGEQIDIRQADARRMRELFSNQSLDLAVCNPPYKAPGAGLVSASPGRRVAWHEETLTLQDLALGAAWALRFGGRLCLCLRPERLAEAMTVLRAQRLEPKRLRLVQQRLRSAPSLFLLECRSGGKTGLSVEPVLLLEDEKGNPTQELEQIYGPYRGTAGTEEKAE